MVGWLAGVEFNAPLDTIYWSSGALNSTPTNQARNREIAEPGKKDDQTDMLEKQVVQLQKQLAELQEKSVPS